MKTFTTLAAILAGLLSATAVHAQEDYVTRSEAQGMADNAANAARHDAEIDAQIKAEMSANLPPLPAPPPPSANEIAKAIHDGQMRHQAIEDIQKTVSDCRAESAFLKEHKDRAISQQYFADIRGFLDLAVKAAPTARAIAKDLPNEGLEALARDADAAVAELRALVDDVQSEQGKRQQIEAARLRNKQVQAAIKTSLQSMTHDLDCAVAALCDTSIKLSEGKPFSNNWLADYLGYVVELSASAHAFADGPSPTGAQAAQINGLATEVDEEAELLRMLIADKQTKESTEISQGQFDQMEAEAKRRVEERAAQKAKERAIIEAREHARRFAPDGTVYSLRAITVIVGKKKVLVAPETELRLIRKNSDGTVHVQTDNLQADVPSGYVTNDRDWMRAYRQLHANGEPSFDR